MMGNIHAVGKWYLNYYTTQGSDSQVGHELEKFDPYQCDGKYDLNNGKDFKGTRYS